MKTFVLFVLVLASAGALASQEAPEAVVQRLQSGLKAIDARLPPGDRAQRRDATRELLVATHDLEYMARLCLGSHWGDLEGEQQARFAAAFEELSVSGYADNFTDVQNTRFRLLGTNELPRGRMLVRTELLAAGESPVALDYTLQPGEEGGWRIIDVRANGVSDLALKRAQYSALLEQNGFEKLLARVYEQAGVGES